MSRKLQSLTIDEMREEFSADELERFSAEQLENSREALYFIEGMMGKKGKFVPGLNFTKGRQWAGKPFKLLKWQREIIIQLFGTLREDGYRQYRTCYIEVPKKNGKSEFVGAVSLYCLFADGEPRGEIYCAAGDKEQASIVFDIAAEMVRLNPSLKARTKIIDSRKRMVVAKTGSVYVALSKETATKHGYNPSAVVIDELHAHKSRELTDVLIEGTDYARMQQLIFIITTAGVFDKNSIAWEIHEYALKVLEDPSHDPTFLPVIHAADRDADWTSEEVWKACNPSLGHIIDIDKLRRDCQKALNVPTRQNDFRRFRLNQWVAQLVRWMPMHDWDECAGERTNIEALLGRKCYGGLDLSRTIDITAYILVFPPESKDDKYIVICHFWLPEENMQDRIRRDKVPYDLWVQAGLIEAVPGRVIDYPFVKAVIAETSEMFDIKEIAFDRWNASPIVQDLTDMGFNLDPDSSGRRLVQFGQGYASMSSPTKELLNLVLTRKLAHGGNKVLRWMADNVVVRHDPAGNIKPDKERSLEKIDGIVALIMALDRAQKHETFKSAYDDGHEVITF